MCAELLCLDCCNLCDADGAVVRLPVATRQAMPTHLHGMPPISLVYVPSLYASTASMRNPCKAERHRRILLPICSPEDSYGPGLDKRPCCRCPKDTFCPAHVDLCILTCTECGDAACANCSTKPPKIMACRICNHAVRPARVLGGHGERQIRCCMDCGAVPQCSVSAPGFKCVTCNALLTQGQ